VSMIMPKISRPEFGEPSAVKWMRLGRPGRRMNLPVFHSTLSSNMHALSNWGLALARDCDEGNTKPVFNRSANIA
jgi:hypothetical protein